MVPIAKSVSQVAGACMHDKPGCGHVGQESEENILQEGFLHWELPAKPCAPKKLSSLPLPWQLTGGPFKRKLIFQVPPHRCHVSCKGRP